MSQITNGDRTLTKYRLPGHDSVLLQKSTSGDDRTRVTKDLDYPVDVRIPQDAYIPQSTVYFDILQSSRHRNAAAWRPREFVDSLSELLR